MTPVIIMSLDDTTSLVYRVLAQSSAVDMQHVRTPQAISLSASVTWRRHRVMRLPRDPWISRSVSEITRTSGADRDRHSRRVDCCVTAGPPAQGITTNYYVLQQAEQRIAGGRVKIKGVLQGGHGERQRAWKIFFFDPRKPSPLGSRFQPQLSHCKHIKQLCTIDDNE